MLLSWWSNAEVGAAKRAAFWLLVLILGLVALALLATGRGIFAPVPLLLGGWQIYKELRSASNAGGQNSGDWQNSGDRGSFGKEPSSGAMTRQEALDILGLSGKPSKNDINTAYKKLMSRLHPDKGGTDWMAVKLNEARRTLLED